MLKTRLTPWGLQLNVLLSGKRSGRIKKRKHVREKAAQNLKNKKNSGGGPKKEQTFSPIKEAIYQLIGMKSSVEGVPVKPVGLTDTSLIEEMLASPEDIECVDKQFNIAGQKEDITPDKEDTADTSRKRHALSQKGDLKSSYEALQQELYRGNF